MTDKQRYEVTFVIETDVKNVGHLPWYPLIGDEVMPMEWLEYVQIRPIAQGEMSLADLTPDDSYTVLDMTYQNDEPPLTAEELKLPDYINLVVDNDAEDTEDKSDSKDPSGE
jgi:hypothetical protein